MSTQGWIDVLSRWLHILSIVAWFGGNAFLLLALKPAAGSSGAAARPVLEESLLKFRHLVAAATVLVLLSGFAMLGVRVSFAGGFGGLGITYHMLFGIKFLLALTLIGLAHVSSARVARWANQGQPGPPPLLMPRLTLAAAALVIFLGVLLHWM